MAAKLAKSKAGGARTVTEEDGDYFDFGGGGDGVTCGACEGGGGGMEWGGDDGGGITVIIPPPMEEMAAPDCVFGAITVCTIRGPAPIPFLEPDPLATVPPPSSGWNLCSLLGWGCDAPVAPPQAPPRKSIDEEVQECFNQYEVDLDECGAYHSAYGSATYVACKARAADYYSACLSRARH